MSGPRRSLDQEHSIIEAGHYYGVLLDTREIFIHGDFNIDGETGTKFVTNISILLNRSKDKPIIIHQHSNGGDWNCGMMIFDAIVACPCPIIFICHGIAASMGSIIPMACKKHGDAYIINMPNCEWLIHDGTTGINTEHTIKQSRSWGEREEHIRKLMMDWYADSCVGGKIFEGKSKSQVKQVIKRHLDKKVDWWLTAREAVEYGFADAVLGDEGFESIANIKKHWD